MEAIGKVSETETISSGEKVGEVAYTVKSLQSGLLKRGYSEKSQNHP